MALPRLIVTPLFRRLISTKGTEGDYEGDVSEGKAHGRGRWTTLHNHTYNGEFVENQKHGEGTYTWQNARVRYVGKWLDDDRHGDGTQTYLNGSTYEGEWVRGNRHGCGKYTSMCEETRYEGEWLFDRKHGMGTLVEPKGEYVGHFVSDTKSGEGTMTQKDGYQYVGGWRDDQKDGKARATWRDGRVFEGYYKNNRTSHGTMTYPPTAVHVNYEGEWANNNFNGYGSALFQNRKSYEGYWKNGEMNGKGEMVMPCGARYIGNFENGVRSGHGRLTHTCGSTYVGTFKNGKRHGEGIHTLPNGDRYEGGFRNDGICGIGRCIWNTGEHAGEVQPGYTPPRGTFTAMAGGTYAVSGWVGRDGVDVSTVVSTMDSAAAVEGGAGIVDSVNPCPVAPEPAGGGSDEMVKRRMKEMEKKLEELENEKLCDVCYESPKAIHFLPCNHVCCCDTCAIKVEKCPICRNPITGRVPSFRS